MGFLIDMINVGQGDSFLLTLDHPNGGEASLLIDAGVADSATKIVEHVRTYAPNGLALLIATHLDNDHIGGIRAVLENINVNELVLNIPPKLTETWYPLRKRLDSYKQIRKFGKLADTIDVVQSICAVAKRKTPEVKITQALQGRFWTCGEVQINVLNPTDARLAQAWQENSLLGWIKSDIPVPLLSGLLASQESQECDAPDTSAENDSSIVLEILHKKLPYALLAGDAGAGVLKEVTRGKKYPFLKVSHHGSKTGLDLELARQLSPSTAYIPVGENPHGHPCLEVLDILQQVGANTFCSNKTPNCRKSCSRDGGFGHLCHRVEKEFRANWNVVDANQCANNGKRRGAGS